MKWASVDAAGVHQAAASIPLYVGVPMAAALNRDPRLPAAAHPIPNAIATIFHADMGKTLLFGTIPRIP